MAAPTFNSTLVARLAQAAYGTKLGQATMAEAIAAAASVNGGVSGLMNALYQRDFGSQTTAQVTATVVQNLGVPAAAVADATAYITGQLNQATAATRGDALIGVVNLWSTLTSNAVVGAAVKQFNADIVGAVAYSQAAGTLDFDLRGGVFNLDSSGAGVMRLTGNHNVRIDITRTTDQVTGLDLNRNGVIEFNGRENVNPTTADDGKNFNIVDAYSRDALNSTDITKNYQGTIWFDGSGFAGNGTSTNGNIFLGGIGSDIALGGIGNDFLAGGGARTTGVVGGTVIYGGLDGAGDDLAGGRNADFFFGEISRLSATDGNGSRFSGGTTADNTSNSGQNSPAGVNVAGGLGTQDNDWLLLEASDDDEPVVVTLQEGSTNANNVGRNVTAASGSGFGVADMESVNASGNLYGFLNSVSTVVGARSYDGYADGYVAGAENYGRGSTAQLQINGSAAANAIIAGYDNDLVNAGTGNDLLMGGDLRFLITNKNNPNLLDAKGGLNLNVSGGLVNDGRDVLNGQDGSDNIVFEADGGIISGGGDAGKLSGQTNTDAAGNGTARTDDKPYTGPRFQSQGDTLWVTDFSMGRLTGALLADEGGAQAAAMSKLTTDSVFRIDLGDGANFKNYGGNNATTSQDTTNYIGAQRVAMSAMESINVTGLGAIDYLAAGSNAPELKFNNQQNYAGFNGTTDLRGTGRDNALLSGPGNDTIEGRGGDDVISGGGGNDRVLMSFNDGIDWMARPVDANGDGLWDTTGGLVVASGVAWGQDFRATAAATAGTQTLVVDFGSTVLNGNDTFVATFQVRIDGKDFGTTIPVATLAVAKTLAEVVSIVNLSYNAQDKNVSVVIGQGNTLEVRAIDPTPLDPLPVIGTTPQTGFFVSGQASGVGTYQAKGAILGQAGTNLEDDRLVIKDYASGFGNRSINLGADQTKVAISQAAQMVASFAATGSTIAQANAGYTYRLYLDSVQEGDKVTVTINGTKYEYTLLPGETAENAATKLQAVIANFLDKDAASGTVGATAFLNSDMDGSTDAFDVGANQAAVTITQTFANNSAAFMDISATVTREDGVAPFGSVNLHNQTNTMAQLLGFDGRNGALNAQDKDASPVILFQGRNSGNTTMSLLLTAKDTGGALNGMDSNVDADDAAGGFINGDDLLIGGNGADVIDGKTGADRILMSKGTDTAEGGGNSTRGNGSTQVYQDVLQAEERTFGDGTSFKVTLNGAIGAAGVGKGTVAAIKADLTPTGDVTTFSGIELVRVLENNRNSELDVKALSDSIALAVVTGPNGGILAGNNGVGAANERLVVNLTQTFPNPSTTYTIDNNADGDTNDDGESYVATAVLGIESVTTGNANDTIIVDQSQANANNRFSMGGQQDNAKTFVKGTDVVSYQHGTLAAADRPVFTVSVLGAGSSTVGMTGGALGTATFTDTLTNVEVVDVAAGATSSANRDVLNVSAVSGATVNYGAAILVGSSLGGKVSPVTSTAIADGNQLDSGAVAASSALSAELVTITGILNMERVTGSASDDRVIVNNTMGTVGAATSNVGVASYLGDAGTVAARDNGTYRFDLADGKNDIVDYRQETGNVAVVVSYDGTTDSVLVDSNADGDLIDANDRVDRAINVERFFAGTGISRIDLSEATSDATIQFSAESKVNSNEFLDPNGRANPVVDNQVRGISVTKADTTVVARFMNADAGDTLSSPLALWRRVEGSSFAETVNFTNFENGSASTLNLKGGANVVSYNQLTQPNIEITAAIAAGSQTYSITPNGGATDTVTIDRTVGGGLTIIATNDSDDTVSNAFAAPTKLTGAATALTDLTGTAGYGYHLIDLNAGQVIEDVTISVGGTYSTTGYLNNVTKIQQFENAAGGGQEDRIFGNGSNNVLSGGAGNDIISGGGGGDTLAGGADNDRFTYGTLQDGAPFTGAAAMTAAGADRISDFDAAGNDVLVVDAGLFGQLYQNVTNSIDVAPIAVATNGANLDAGNVFLVTTAVAANANLLVLADVAAAIGTIAGAAIADGKFFGAGGANEASQSAVFIVGTIAGTDAGVYIWRDANDNNTVTAGELSLVSLITGQGVVAAGADAAGEFRAADVVVRTSGTGGQQTFNLNNADLARTELVYTSTAQSRIGFVDNLNGFSAVTDRIDLSGIFTGQTLSQSAISAFRATAAAGNNTGVSVAGFFSDAGTNRAVVVEEFAGGGNTRVFVDANLDGNFDIATDLVIDFAGIGLAITADTFIFG